MPRSHLPELDTFLNLLFPWDDAGSRLYKSVSWTWQKTENGQITKGPPANYAAQDYAQLVRLIESKLNRPNTDLYICLGTQRVVATGGKISNDGFPQAMRRAANIVSHNSVYLDIDVKPGAYATTNEALYALAVFVAKVGLPPPSMIVESGSGGIHVYWCTVEAMPPEAWLPLAKALRDHALAAGLYIDGQVTVNPPGILRIPGSYNWKRNPPVKVVLNQGSSLAQYTYNQLMQPLNVKLAASVQVGAVKVGSGGAGPGQTVYTQNFTDNLSNAPPPPIDAVAEECLVVRDILDRGGNGDPEPLWNLALMLASFTEDPGDAAHRMSEGDPRYTPAETDKKLGEKENARLSNPAIGWPLCDSFNALTQKCPACKYFQNHKSPLTYASRETPMPASFTVRPDDELMPPEYQRDGNDHVMTYVRDKDDNPVRIDVLGKPILDGGVDNEEKLLVFQVVIGGVPVWRSIPFARTTQPADVIRALADTGVCSAIHYSKARDFIMAWITHLQSIKRTIAPARYGWTPDQTGFTFNKITYTAKGPIAAYCGRHHDPSFVSVGELKPWQEAMQLVYGQPPLEAVAASAFAAPLVALTESFSTVLSICSARSGVGKTTAMTLGLAAWGHPRTAMTALDDTQNAVNQKLADLQSLPVYWDEIKTADQLEKIVALVFAVAQGKGKARLKADVTKAEVSDFTTMFCVASNHGVADSVYAYTKGTEAGGLRVFEFEPGPLQETITPRHARQLLKRLEFNYGNAGAEYAAFITKNRDWCRRVVEAYGTKLTKQFNFAPKERFWETTMTTLLAGAFIANAAKLTTFDLPSMEVFLSNVFLDLRHRLHDQDYTTIATPDSAKALLAELETSIRGRHLIYTRVVPYPRAGRPVPNELVNTILSSGLNDIWMQIGLDGRIRLRREPFYEWLRERRINPKQFEEQLRAYYHVSHSRQTLGAGIPYVGSIGRAPCIDLTPLPTAPGSSRDAT